MSLRTRFPEVALFDLDGTLLDSAPDMLETVNVMRGRRGIAPMTLAQIRPVVSRGARAMAGTAFPGWSDAEVLAAVPEFLDIYARELGKHCKPFNGIPELLDALEAQGSRWGIVTNKPEKLARDLMPMLHAADAMKIAPDRCVYVGDDRRDIEAGRAAGMPTIAALWGYRVAGDEPGEWGADVMIELPAELMQPARWP